MDYIVLSIPIFFLLIGVELIISRIKKSPLYRFNDAVTNISCGIGQQISGVLFKTILIVGYIFLYDNFRLVQNIPNQWWMYIILFLGVDLCYYWFHRYAHEINFMWGTHVVHHQSEEYNFSVALRQSAFQSIFSSIFYLPLALIGFHPVAFVTINAFQTLYQFWIHTKTIGKLHPVIEFIFNTPSHHRVHHGVNPKYIDRNHGGTLIIFDRMFGTFQEEDEEETVVYGVTRPVASWNPVWANFDYYAFLLNDMREAKWIDRFRMLIKKPGWRPDYMGGPLTPQPITPEQQKKYDTAIPMGLNYYILFQYALILLGTTVFLLNEGTIGVALKTIGIVLIVIAILNLGGIFERKRWALPLEYLRLLALIILAVWYIKALPWYLAVGIFVLMAASLLWFTNYRNIFATQRAPTPT